MRSTARHRAVCTLSLVVTVACGGSEREGIATEGAANEPAADVDAAQPAAGERARAEAGAGGSERATAGSGGQAGTAAAGAQAGAAGSAGKGDGAPSSGQGGAAGSSGRAGGGAGSSADAPGAVLEQAGNPILSQLTRYERWLSTDSTAETKLSADRTRADNMLTWQLPHGGFFKNDLEVYATAWNGSASRAGWTGDDGIELGTIDNGATVNELLFLANVYQRAPSDAYRNAVRRAFDFLLSMQLPSGGFPQVHPARSGTSYSNYVTFNDDAMARALVLLQLGARREPPLDGDVLDDMQPARAEAAIAAAVSFILEAQISQSGVKTVWCAQHDPVSYEPRAARSYEHASKSGSESAGVVAFLMTLPQTSEVKASVQAALAWFASPAVMRQDTAYASRPDDNSDDSYNPIQARAGSTMWCRFYELDRDTCIFSGRAASDDPPGKGKQSDIMEIEPERRYGYQWGGSYGSKLLEYAKSVGY